MDAWTYLQEQLFHRCPRSRRLPEAHVVGQRPGAVTLGTSPPRLRGRNPASRGREGRARRDSTRARQADRRRVLPLAHARPLPQPEPSPPAVFTFPQRRPRGLLPLQRRSAPPPEPRGPPLRRARARARQASPAARPPERGPALYRARQPASRVPPRAAPQLAPRRPRHGPGPAPTARRPCHLAPPPLRPRPPVGSERLGWLAPRLGGPEGGCWAGPGPRAAAEGL